MTAPTRPTGLLGRLPYDHSRANLYAGPEFFHALTGAISAPPDHIDNASTIEQSPGGFPMYLNQSLGCCVEAMKGHAIQVYTGTDGDEITVLDAAILQDYERIGGYDPNVPVGPDGVNPTDGGENIQMALEDWAKVGIQRPDGKVDKILAFAQIRNRDWDTMAAAIEVFESLLIGVNLPESAEEQFANHEVWDVVKNSPIIGGHAVLGAAYTRRPDGKLDMTFVTWGGTVQVTAEWIEQYVEEMWFAVSVDQWGADGINAQDRFNTAQFKEAYTALTGKQFPEPAPEPVDPPAPVDPPSPAPVKPQGWSQFLDAAESWLEHRHVGYSARFARKLVHFLRENGEEAQMREERS